MGLERADECHHMGAFQLTLEVLVGRRWRYRWGNLLADLRTDPHGPVALGEVEQRVSGGALRRS